MSLWKVDADVANSAPVFTADAATGRTGTQNYGNTSVGVIGIFGVGLAESETARANGQPVTPGWVARKVLSNGRIQTETLVAVSHGNAVNLDGEDDDAIFPDAQT